MENLIYWDGVAIGIESGSRVTWFASAPKEVIAAMK